MGFASLTVKFLKILWRGAGKKKKQMVLTLRHSGEAGSRAVNPPNATRAEQILDQARDPLSVRSGRLLCRLCSQNIPSPLRGLFHRWSDWTVQHLLHLIQGYGTWFEQLDRGEKKWNEGT